MKKDTPTRKQVDARREQRTMAQRLTVWREGRRAAADAREAKRRKAAKARRKKESRGVDRVPERLRVDPPKPVYLIQHTAPNYAWRRARALSFGTEMATGTNQPVLAETLAELAHAHGASR